MRKGVLCQKKTDGGVQETSQKGLVSDLDVSINFGMCFVPLRIRFYRSQVGTPITHSHEYGASDDVADRYGQEVPP